MAPPPTRAAPTELFFSEYIEGTSNNKALKRINGTGAPIDLAANGYNIQMHFNGNPLATLTINLTGNVASGDVYVVAQASAAAVLLAQADQTNGPVGSMATTRSSCAGHDRARRHRPDRI